MDVDSHASENNGIKKNGRLHISEIYKAFFDLERSGLTFNEQFIKEYNAKKLDLDHAIDAKYVSNKGWTINHICNSWSRTWNFTFPIISIDNNLSGDALWIIAGIHGNERAGPVMLTKYITEIADSLKDIPTLILPLCNPIGYVMHQKYIDAASEDTSGDEKYEKLSVADPDHLLLKRSNALVPFARNFETWSKGPKNTESECITAHLLEKCYKMPPKIVLNLHEDALLDNGYIYSHGIHGSDDNCAIKMVETLKRYFPMQDSGLTRFGENVSNGIISQTDKRSIDTFIASEYIGLADRITSGINAETVISIETPGKGTALGTRILAQYAALKTAISEMHARMNENK